MSGLRDSFAGLACFGWVDWWPIAFGAAASVALFPVVLNGLVWIKRGSLRASRATYRGRA